MADEKDPIIKCFKSATTALKSAVTYDELTAICRTIDSMGIKQLNLFNQHCVKETYLKLNPPASPVVELLVKIFQNTKNLAHQKTILKAILKPALCMNYCQVEDLFKDFAKRNSKIGMECLRYFTWHSNSRFTEKFDVSLPNTLSFRSLIDEIAEMSYSKDTKYFALAVENIVIVFDAYGSGYRGSYLKIILENLENSHQDVRKLLFELFIRLLKSFDKPDVIDPDIDLSLVKPDKFIMEKNELVNEILQLPWTNRNKFPLISHLMTIKPEILLNHPKFDEKKVVEGCFMGLTLHHLLSPSQGLVKVIHNQNPFREIFIKRVSEVLWDEDEKKAANLIRYWFSSFDKKFVDELYSAMSLDGKFLKIPTTSTKFHRLLMIKNAFKRTFKDEELDLRIQKFCCDLNEDETKIEIFHVLMNSANAEPNLLNILTLLKFLQTNMTTTDSNFVDHHVMRKLPDFFNLFTSKKLRKLEIQKKIFFNIKEEIFDHGFELGSYEALSFSLKILNIILKQYCGGAEKNRLSKNTNIVGNLSFGKFLKENQIWDLTGREVLSQLMKLVDEKENTDLSDLAVKILVEFFVKSSHIATTFKLLAGKFDETLNHPELTVASSCKRYLTLMVEFTEDQDMTAYLDMLATRFAKLREENDLVKSLKRGLHLFNVIEIINYGLKNMNASGVCEILADILMEITNYFLNLIYDKESPMSFEVLDQKLTELSQNSPELKPTLLLWIFYTLRSISEVTESMAKISQITEPSSFEKVMSSSIKINVKILSICCHKGIIESASEALGKITKIISQNFSKLCNRNVQIGFVLHRLLLTLKREIDCGDRSTVDIRSSRGLVLMSHQIIAGHPPFLKFLMEKLLANDESFRSEIKPVQLHLIAALIKDGSLVEEMLQFYNSVLLATLKGYKNSSDFVMLNALLQVVGVIVPKISNQKRHVTNEVETMLYEPKALSVQEFFTKFNPVFRYGLSDLKKNRKDLSDTYVIILLEIFSNFEYRSSSDTRPEFIELRGIFEQLMSHRCEKIRILSGKCFALWENIDDRMLNSIREKTYEIFDASGNEILSTVNCVRIMIERYESCEKFVGDFDVENFKAHLRAEISSRNFKTSPNFYIRCKILSFFIFLGFSSSDNVVVSLMSEKSNDNSLGYSLWVEKVEEIYGK